MEGRGCLSFKLKTMCGRCVCWGGVINVSWIDLESEGFLTSTGKAQRGHQQSSCLTIWCCIHKVTRYLGLDSHSISKVSTEIFIKLKNLRIHPQIPHVTTIRSVWMSVSLTKVSTEALFKLNKPNKMEFRFQSSLITELRIQRFPLSSACLLQDPKWIQI